MNDRHHRLIFWTLLIATILSALWSLFIYHAYGFGAADFLYGDYRHRLRQEIEWERADRFTSQAALHVNYSVHQAISCVVVPFLSTNLAWAWLARHLMNSRRRASG
jgi:hypothetical protein